MMGRSAEPRSWIFVLASLLLHLGRLLSLHPATPLPPSAPQSEVSLSIIAQALGATEQPSSAAPPLRASAQAPPGAAHASLSETVRHPLRSRGERARPSPSRAKRAPSVSESPAFNMSWSTAGTRLAAARQPTQLGQRLTSERLLVPEAVAAPPLVTSEPILPARLDLSPRRAASTVSDRPVTAAHACEARSSVTPTEACASHGQTTSSQQTLTRWLQQSARTLAYLNPRPPPTLRHAADGSYSYHGRAISAEIDTDGTVEFTDRDPGRKHPRRARDRDSAEKRWFLEQTEALRTQLADTSRTEAGLHARRALELDLERILSATELDASDKRRRILALWEESASEADSYRARHIVEAFVRAHMPETSPLGFSREALDTFNRLRKGMLAFDPYEPSNNDEAPPRPLPTKLAHSPR